MKRNREGYVIAFHNNEETDPYKGLDCRDRAINNIKPHVPKKIGEESFRGDRDGPALKWIGLERDLVVKESPEAMEFVLSKIRDDKPIFLDLREGDAVRHNRKYGLSHFVMVSILVNRKEEFRILNPECFSHSERADIIALVIRSQGGTMMYVNDLGDKSLHSMA